jgi:hypothetical protein
MGFFKNSVNERVLDLKEISQNWANDSDLPLLRDDLKISIALVDCRLCMTAEHAVLFNKTVWGFEQCMVSYSWCFKKRRWISESQGSGLLGKTGHVPSNTSWSTWDPKNKSSIWKDSNNLETIQLSMPSIEFWLLADLHRRVVNGKLAIADSIMKKKDPEWISILNELLRLDPI